MQERGFSLMEIVIVIAIVAVIAAIVSVSFSNLINQYSAQNTAIEVRSVIDEARFLSTSSHHNSEYGVHLATTSVTRFAGSVYQPNDPGNVEVQLPPGIEIVHINLAGGESAIVFNKVTGATVQSGTFTLRERNDSSTDTTVTVHKTGVTEIVNP